MPTLSLLTGCASNSAESAQTLSIYDPDALTVEAGTTIMTVDGLYTAQKRTTFHSDKRYRTLERQYEDQLATATVVK